MTAPASLARWCPLAWCMASLLMNLASPPLVAQEVEATDPTGDEAAIEKALAQELEVRASIAWEDGPLVGKLGGAATIRVPPDYAFTGGVGARKLLEHWGNLTDGSELGLVEPTAEGAGDWQALFEWAEVGKVEDDEKLDAEELFEQMKEGEEEANEQRKKRGFEPLELVRFTTPPHYDPVTHNLEWGLLVRSPSGESINYLVKVLGRFGFMSVTLLCRPEDVEVALPPFRELLAGFEFVEGKRYAEWKQGDPIAEFGITGLVVGGAAAAAWKLGLLGKLAKFAKVIVIAVVAGAGAVWRYVTGRSKRPDSP